VSADVVSDLERVYRGMRRIAHPAVMSLKEHKRFVPGTGSLTPKFILVGEAPGRTENTQGEPFVGAAGAVLNDTLLKSGQKRANMFITNAVKYWPTVKGSDPPDTRRPSLAEVLAFRPWLVKEIAALKCFNIILLGKTAQEVFWPSGGPDRGVWAPVPGLPFRAVMLHHPAVGCYRPTMRPQMVQEFRRALVSA
jgi:uracil-DNA glycosylase